jgi:hypothetical protein
VTKYFPKRWKKTKIFFVKVANGSPSIYSFEKPWPASESRKLAGMLSPSL